MAFINTLSSDIGILITQTSNQYAQLGPCCLLNRAYPCLLLSGAMHFAQTSKLWPLQVAGIAKIFSSAQQCLAEFTNHNLSSAALTRNSRSVEWARRCFNRNLGTRVVSAGIGVQSGADKLKVRSSRGIADGRILLNSSNSTTRICDAKCRSTSGNPGRVNKSRNQSHYALLVVWRWCRKLKLWQQTMVLWRIY